MHLVKNTYASFWQRLLAHNIDLLLLVGLFYLYSLLPSLGFDSIFFYLIYVLYHSAFELSGWRATPGKKWVRITVKNHDKRFKSLLAVPLRNATKAFSLLLFFLGFVLINFSKRKQGLHDLIAGTVVLFEEELA